MLTHHMRYFGEYSVNSEKIAIITAAGKGIGAGIARELASNGYRVATMSPSGNATKLAEEIGGIGLTGSVTSEDDIKLLVSKTLDRYGRIDAVINNTGHLPSGDLLALGDAEWQTGFEMILLNVMRMLREVTPVFLSQGGGSVVNISAYGAVAPDNAFPISSALRAALSAYTRLYAERYASNNIRINSVLPGFVDSWDAPPEIIARIPMGRIATIAEVAKTVAFLLSDGGAYITGQNILIDGALVNAV
jgi:NAD(P)-dependent dehydrogenase (short-subunit alcohol dehydrogenase family)